MSQPTLHENFTIGSAPAEPLLRITLAGAAFPRRLQDKDRAKVLAHLLRLSADDRQMRFCRAFNDESVERYVSQIDFDVTACYGVFGEDAELVALAQSFAYVDGDVATLEAAFSTDARARRAGLGTLLFHEVTDHAVAHGIDRVIAQCLAGNRPMRALLRAVGAVCGLDDGEVTGRLEVAGHA